MPEVCMICERENVPGCGPCIEGTPHSWEFRFATKGDYNAGYWCSLVVSFYLCVGALCGSVSNRGLASAPRVFLASSSYAMRSPKTTAAVTMASFAPSHDSSDDFTRASNIERSIVLAKVRSENIDVKVFWAALGLFLALRIALGATGVL